MESPVVLAYASLGCGQKRYRRVKNDATAPSPAAHHHHHNKEAPCANEQIYNDSEDDDNDNDDASIAAMHAMKRLKVNDDTFIHYDERGNRTPQQPDFGEDEEDDEKSSITSVSSIDSCTPTQRRPTPTGLTLEDYPPTPKCNNRTSRRKMLRPLLPSSTETAGVVAAPMNTFLGRLHHERQRPHAHKNLVHGMDALSIAPDSLLLPVLSSSSPTSTSSSKGGRWKVQLRTDSKLE